jgi:hypothetical protein
MKRLRMIQVIHLAVKRLLGDAAQVRRDIARLLSRQQPGHYRLAPKPQQAN